MHIKYVAGNPSNRLTPNKYVVQSISSQTFFVQVFKNVLGS